MSVMAEGYCGRYGLNRTVRQIMELLWNARTPLSLLGTIYFIKNIDFKPFLNVSRETFILIYTNFSAEWFLFCPQG